MLLKATEAAFEAPFQDNRGVLRNFLKKMEECRNRWCENDHSRRLYAPYIPIVQASMMGKSRMFFTLPKHDIFVFYLCLRKGESSVFPKSIPELTEALTEPCTEGFYSAFFLAALDALHTFKESYKGPRVFDAWFLEQQHTDFWTKIICELTFFSSTWLDMLIETDCLFPSCKIHVGN